MHFPHIDRYENVRGRLHGVPVRAKVKLHGTHGRIDVAPDGTMQAYSRSRLLTPAANDNFGFAAWVAAQVPPEQPCTIYGEWYGQGIQAGVALSQLKWRAFAVFAAMIGGVFTGDPDALAVLLGSMQAMVLPWHGPVVPDGSELNVAATNAEIEAIATECPWAHDIHGIDGPGEGLVYYRLDTGWPAFKVKAPNFTHSPGIRTKPQVSPNVFTFIDNALHISRLEQAVQETGPRTPENTSAFLKWIGRDVQRECAAELVASGLVWSDVAKTLARKASQWYLQP